MRFLFSILAKPAALLTQKRHTPLGLLLLFNLFFPEASHAITAVYSAAFSPSTIKSGESSILSWASNGIYCVVDGIQYTGPNGSRTYTHVTYSKTVDVSCTLPEQMGGDGTTTKSATLTVTNPSISAPSSLDVSSTSVIATESTSHCTNGICIPRYYGSVSVSWPAASGSVTHYEAQKQFNGGSWSSLYTDTSRSITSSWMEVGTWRFRVRACHDSDCSDYRYSSDVSVTYPTPSIPDSMSISPTPTEETNVSARWSGVSGRITHYEAQRRLGSGSWSNFYSGGGSSATSSAMSTGNWTFRVRACNESACGLYREGNAVTILEPTPSVPDSLTLSPASTTNTYVDATWAESTSGPVTHYDVQRKVTDGSWSTFYSGAGTVVTSTTRKVSSTSMTVGVWEFRVRACNETQCSQFRHGGTATVHYPAPGIPESISVPSSSTTGTSSNVEWGTASGHVARYEAERKKVDATTWENFYSGPGTSAISENMSVGLWEFQVRACNASNYCGGDRSGAQLEVKDSLFTATPSLSTDGHYTLNWTLLGGSSIYSVDLDETDPTGTVVATSLSPTTVTKAYTNKADGEWQYSLKILYCYTSNACFPSVRHITVQVTQKPATISSITLPSDTADGTFDITWARPAGNITTYEIQRRLVGASSWTTLNYTGPEEYYSETDLPNGEYEYQIRTSNNGVWSDWKHSSTLSVLHQPQEPSYITLAMNASSKKVDINWEATPFTDFYNITRQKNDGPWGPIIRTDHTAQFSEPNTLVAGNYRYQVQACNVSGCSLWKVSTVLVIQDTTSRIQTPPTATLASPSLVSATEIAETDQLGTLVGSFNVNTDGAATFDIPIMTATGTAGVSPSIGLSYSSTGANGLAGQGWSLNATGAIVRCRQTLIHERNPLPITWGADDRFCLGGQKLLVVSGTYGAPGSQYKTQIDTLARITAIGGKEGTPDYFEVENKDGSSTRFGGPGTHNSEENARDNTGNILPNKVRVWSESRFQDSVGNPIEYLYENTQQLYGLKEIHYAFGAGTTANAKIIVNYETRDDFSETYFAGYRFKNNKRIRSIESYNNQDDLLRQYTLNYLPIDHDTHEYNISRISSIEECVSDSNCLAPTEFTWQTQDIAIDLIQDQEFTLVGGMTGITYADINGDGLLDSVWVESEVNPTTIQQSVHFGISQSNGSGLYEAESGDYNDDIPFTFIVDRKNALKGTIHFDGLELVPMDYNGDGRADIMVKNPNKASGEKWTLLLSIPIEKGQWRLEQKDIGSVEDNAEFFDFNSDGLVDSVEFEYFNANENVITHHLKIRTLERDPSQPATSQMYYTFSDAENRSFSINKPNHPWRIEAQPQYADFNGDGLLDFVVLLSTPCLYPICDATAILEDLRKTEHMQVFLQNPKTKDFDHAQTIYNLPEGISSDDAGFTVRDYWSSITNISVIDINLDGQLDIAYSSGVKHQDKNSDTATRTGGWRYVINNGVTFEPPSPFFTNNSVTHNTSVLNDQNHDGYPDFVFYDKNDYKVKFIPWDINLKHFSNTIIELTLPLPGKPSSDQISLSDMNADNSLDVIKINSDETASRLSIYQGPGHTGRADIIHTITNGLGHETTIYYGPMASSGHYSTLVTQAGINPSESNVCQTLYINPNLPTQICHKTYVDRLDKDEFYREINEPFSQLGSQYDVFEHPVSMPVHETSGALPLVTSVTSKTPTPQNPNHVSTLEYYYHQGRIQAGSGGSLGFKSFTVYDNASGISSTSSFRQDWPYIGTPIESVSYSKEGNLLSRSETISGTKNYANIDLSLSAHSGTTALGPLQVYIKGTSDTAYDLKDNGAIQGPPLATTLINTAIDQYGNTTHITRYLGEGDNFEDRIKTTYTQKITTESEYGASDEEQFLGRLSTSTVTTENPLVSPSIQSKTAEYSYYDLSGSCRSSDSGHAGNLSGLLCQETLKVSGLTHSTVQYYYDQFGNKTFTHQYGEDNAHRLSGFSEYDSTGRYLEKTYSLFDGSLKNTANVADHQYHTLASTLGVSIHLTGDVVKRNLYGNPAESRAYLDNDSYLTAQSYITPFGKVYFETNSTGSYAQYTTSRSDIAHCPTGTLYTAKTLSAGGGESYICFDLQARNTRSISKAFDGNWVYTDTEYDPQGRITRTSTPYQTGDTPYWTVKHNYDILNRAHTITLPIFETDQQGNPTGVLATSHITTNGFTTEETNTKGQTKTTVKDLLGNIASVTNHQGHTATYRYNLYGQLIEMTDPDSNRTILTYNQLGQKTDMDDPDKGQWHYQYNSLGQLTCQQNANGHTTHNTYDIKGRIIERLDRQTNHNGCTNPTGTLVGHAYWQFDTAENGWGQLSDEQDTTTGYQITYHYDTLGRSDTLAIYTPGAPAGNGMHYTKTTYDQYGRPFQTFDAARDTPTFDTNGIQHIYNPHGFLHKIIDAEHTAGETANTYYEIQHMDPRGNITQYQLGDGVITKTALYDERSGLITAQQTASWQTLRHHTLAWDHAGNLAYREETGINENGQTRHLREDFAYDTLNRLESATYTNGKTANTTHLTYNRIGNITDKTGVGPYHYQNDKPHAVSQAGNHTYHYDHNGNMTHDSRGRNIHYTVFDKAATLTHTDRTTTFHYGTNRKRFKRTDTGPDGTTTRLYLGSVEKIFHADNTQQWKRTIGGFAQITHTFNDQYQETEQTTHYHHTDHLGSINLITDGQGNIVQTLAFDPWGKRRNTTTWDPMLDLDISTHFFAHKKPLTQRGFTGHEMVDEMDLIHMNGRIYDSTLGRFLQADPFIQSPTTLGSLNRYSYTLNNPLNAIDPSGFFIARFEETSYKHWKPFYRSLAKKPGMYTAFNILTVTLASKLGGPWVGAAVASHNASHYTYAVSGDRWAASRAGATTFAYAMATYFIGQYVSSQFASTAGTAAQTASSLSATGIAVKVILHALAGGIHAKASGGSVQDGALAAGVSAFVSGKGWAGPSGEMSTQGLIVSALVGGTVSRLSGGKFANGAFYGFMTYILNNATEKGEAHEEALEKTVVVDNPSALDKSARRAVFKINKGLESLRAGLNAEGDPNLVGLWNKSTFKFKNYSLDNGSEITEAQAFYDSGNVHFYKDIGMYGQSFKDVRLTVFHEFRHLQTENYNMKRRGDFLLGGDADFERDARHWAWQFNKNHVK